MKTKPPINSMALARRAVHLFNYDLAPLHVNKHNRRRWLESVKMLGDRWIGLPRAIAKLQKPLRSMI